MTRRIKLMIGACAALSVAGLGQVAVYTHDHSPVTQQASWSFQPKNAKAVRDRAKAIVLAEVVSTQPGEDIVTKQPNEPGGVDRIPTTRIIVKVIKSYKGATSVGEQVTLFQTGGTTELPAAPADGKSAQTHVQQFVLEGDPTYVSGEQYLLMLEPGPSGTLRPVSPQGRYHYDKNSGVLTGVVKDAVSNETTSKQLSSMESGLRTSN
jgi:hypothetical protein